MKHLYSLKLTGLILGVVIFGANSGAAQDKTNYDFEVVEAGQGTKTVKRNTENTSSETLKNNPVSVEPRQPTKVENNSNVRKQRRGGSGAEVKNAQLSATGNLPLRVEVSDLQPSSLITLAVGAATRFHCEEKPTRLVIGNLTDIGVTQAGSKTWYGFYLRPVNGGITTNMFIEFASGATVMINVKTVSPKALKPGDYNSEVFVKTAAVRDEMTRLRKDNEATKTENGSLRVQLADVKTKFQDSLTENEGKLSESEMWKFLEQTSGGLKNRDGFVRGSQIEKLKINGLSPVWEVKKGTGYIWMELENNGKTAVQINSLALLGAVGEIGKSIADLTVEPNKTLRFGLKINVKTSENGPVKVRFTTSDGKTADIGLSGFAGSLK